MIGCILKNTLFEIYNRLNIFMKYVINEFKDLNYFIIFIIYQQYK